MSERADPLEPDALPSVLIAAAGRLLARVTDVRFRALGISVSQFAVLVALKDGARLSQKELARLASVEQPSMAQLLARMERDGLIQREPDPGDGRSSLVSLTASALSRIGPARAALAQGDREALADFEASEVQQLTCFLRRIIANVNDINALVAEAPAARGWEADLISGP